MGDEYLSDTLPPDGCNHPLGDEVTRDFLTVPDRERTPARIGAFTGDLDRLKRYFGGEK
jgi:hypothetical protein